MEQFVSPKLVARAIGVSESTIKRWCDRGVLQTVRTAGGHRRMPMTSVVDFIRSTRQHLIEPHLLGLPEGTGKSDLPIQAAPNALCEALLRGDEGAARKVVLDLYLANMSAVDIFDRVIAPAMYEIGRHWEHNSAEIFQERRACEVVNRILFEIRSVLPTVRADAPYALGGTLVNDQYRLATTMVELSLREAGWRAESYGTDLPFATLASAVLQTQPRLCWISVSAVQNPAEFVTGFSEFAKAAMDAGVAVVVGGRGLTAEIRRELVYSAYCDTFRHLAHFAATLYQPGPNHAEHRSRSEQEDGDHDEMATITP